jgi:hypothetical protein
LGFGLADECGFCFGFGLGLLVWIWLGWDLVIWIGLCLLGLLGLQIGFYDR